MTNSIVAFVQTPGRRLKANPYLARMLAMITDREMGVASNLVVRNVDDDIALALKQMAVAHGRSAEAEHREILRAALQRPKRRSVAEVLASMPNVGQDADFNVRSG
jgi:plasmid stability protein